MLQSVLAQMETTEGRKAGQKPYLFNGGIGAIRRGGQSAYEPHIGGPFPLIDTNKSPPRRAQLFGMFHSYDIKIGAIVSKWTSPPW